MTEQGTRNTSPDSVNPDARPSGARIRATAAIGAEVDPDAALLDRLLDEIADVAMILRPAIGTLDEVAQREALALDAARVLRGVEQRLCGYVRDVDNLTSMVMIDQATATLPVLEAFIEECIDVSCGQSRFVSRLPHVLWPVELAAYDILTICRRLFDNALRATSAGGEIRFSANNVAVRKSNRHAARLPTGDYVRIRMSDNGVGLSEPTQRRASEPFFSTWGGACRWRGLGLSQVRATCRRAHGDLTLDRAEPHGAIATAWLRRAERGDGESMPPPERQTPRPGSRFLVADDEPLVLSWVSQRLANLGYVAFPAQDMGTTWAILEEERCHFGVVDLHLGERSGQDFVREAVSRFPNTRFVVTSGRSQPPTLAGGAAQIRKPFTIDDLLAALSAQPGESR